MKWFFFILMFSLPLLGKTLENPSSHLQTLYHSLDKRSIPQLLAFYHLYSNTPYGEKAFQTAWELLNRGKESQSLPNTLLTLPDLNLDTFIAFINKEPFIPSFLLTEAQLSLIEKLSNHLKNRKLQGFKVWDQKKMRALPSHEIDLARALLIDQFETHKDKKLHIRQYEATIDLMCLQILSRLPLNPSHEEKIEAINQLIFHEKHFRFPPHSLWVDDIDLYTFLPSVIDSRLGICLGVSILYLAIAQRLDLPLEIITPPGHIYLRYKTKDQEINIETTARGVHFPSKIYLGINTYKLQKRTLKEVIGLAYVNQASLFWKKKDFKSTIQLYEKALLYLDKDPLVEMLLGYNYLFIGEKEKGKAKLQAYQNVPLPCMIFRETTPEDYLLEKINAEGIQILFSPVDETRESIIQKQEKLLKILEQYPYFLEGLFQLAITHLQLNQTHQALKTLELYHNIEPNNPTVEYYLSIICCQRILYKKAWKHLQKTEALTKKFLHKPEALKKLKNHLRCLCRDPNDQIHPDLKEKFQEKKFST